MLTVLWGRDVQAAKGRGPVYLGYLLNHFTVNVTDFESLANAVHELRVLPNAYVIRGQVKDDAPPKVRRRFRNEPFHLDDTEHQWLCVDIDGLPSAVDVYKHPQAAVEYARSTLPEGLAGAACYYAITGSAQQHSLNVHLWFWLDRKYTNGELLRNLAGRCDKSLYKPTQPHFTASPIVGNDPLEGRRRSVLFGTPEGFLGAEPMKVDPAAAEAQLQSSMNAIVGAKQGNRHATINRRAYFMGRHVHVGAIDRLHVIETLTASAIQSGVSDSRARDEVCRGLADGIKNAPLRSQWLDKLETNKDGAPRSTYFNSVIALSESAEWRGCLGYSTRASRVEWLQTPPVTGGYATAGEGKPFRDEHAAIGAEWLSSRGMSFARRQLIDTMIDVSHKQPFDPLRNLLDELDWDGIPRLTDMLITYFNVPEAKHAWARVIARKWMIAAIARAYMPGCKADNLLILEGDQGSYKSTALDVLGMGYAKDIRVTLEDKDASDALHSGAWIAVLSELDAFKRTSRAEAVKAFLSMAEDYFRQAYARTTQSHVRSIVFAATTNEETYLNDPTGNRRFWPIGVGVVDLAALRRDVEQLWAEARQAFFSGERWHIETASERELAESEQRARLLPDTWETYVSLACNGKDTVLIENIMQYGLDLDPGRQKPYDINRVKLYLRRLGYGMAIKDGRKVWVKVR